jgi:ABC-type phosphate/phosphonate transport system substrate-binding protein
MCGWPYARSTGMQVIAAPVPSPSRYEGLPRYCSEFLAREANGWRRLEDSFGHRFGWMAANSQSGFNAPRAHLARFTSPSRPALFSESIGPLGNPAKALDALREGKVDIIALDGFYLDLLRHYEPAKLEGIGTIATTAWSPIPLLVAAPSIDRAIVARMSEHLLHVHRDESYRVLLEAVLLDRFVAPDVGAYAAMEQQAQEAIASGYADIR